MVYIIIVIILIILVGLLGFVVFLKQRSFGSVSKEHVYSDAGKMTGEVLFSDEFLLKGKPDYIIQSGDEFIPVEVKTGKTPQSSYKNHIMQLVAYCVLVEANYPSRPSHGIIKYPDNEFVIDFTDEKKNELRKIMEDMRVLQESGEEPTCSHPDHQL